MTRSILLLCVITQTFAAKIAGANRPWKPNITVEAAEGIGRRRQDLGPDANKLFTEAYHLGEELLEIGRYEQARAALAQAIKMRPNHVATRLLHARTLLTLGYLEWNISMIKEARSDMLHAQKIEPKNVLVNGMVELLDGLLKRMRDTSSKAIRKGVKRIPSSKSPKIAK
jgi:tetratricopeptide (TPR) repeat protein